ncbi:cytochrome c [Hymenobacter busanensis]|uniref:Cytochrome c n=1 Tax=Hymenobacter busanensis TaxID=2607656 RepID=A0A7L4ZWN7_9BACT|nr:cytochrome c [Hymenobacter busanensis]KAA9339622.1 cytochrome c [Hymenobacter busanensis]QHJ06622.1 c-type cytochrome [Hymenobacter busanensis]
MKKVLRVLGLLVAGLVFLGACAATFVQVRGIPSYDVPKLKLAPVAYTPARIEHGRRLAMSICASCHFDKKTGRFSGQELKDIPAQFGRFYSANITSDKAHGIGGWTDAQVVTLLRTGIGPDGRIRSVMPSFERLSDEDVLSIVAFLRSGEAEVQPASQTSHVQEPSFFGNVLANTIIQPAELPAKPILQPNPADAVAFGNYLVTSRYKCYDCHSGDILKTDSKNPEKSFGYMGGGSVLQDAEGHDIISRNLTADPETGTGDWTAEQFTQAMKYGKSPNGVLRYPMPKYSLVTDDEARAIFAYLRTVPVIKNATPEDGSAAVAAK